MVKKSKLVNKKNKVSRFFLHFSTYKVYIIISIIFYRLKKKKRER